MPFRMSGCARYIPAIICWVLPADAVQAGVVVDGTRVVYPSDKREVSVNLHNVGDAPSLVQVWIDAGNDQAKPGNEKVPFALTPPLFRLDPAKGQTLRLIYTQDPLPSDRESVFWLNVLDIPPRAATNLDTPNHLEMAFRHRLKLFFRPASLRGNPADAPAAVTWTILNHDGATVLEARNPTAFDVSFTEATVVIQGVTQSARTEMLRPFSTAQFPLVPRNGTALANGSAGRFTIRYSFVNDFGAVLSGNAMSSLAP